MTVSLRLLSFPVPLCTDVWLLGRLSGVPLFGCCLAETRWSGVSYPYVAVSPPYGHSILGEHLVAPLYGTQPDFIFKLQSVFVILLAFCQF
jgi:hypothetical protein